MMRHSFTLRIAFGCAIGLFAVAGPCEAQEAPVGQAQPARREFESRAEIEAQAKAAEAQHRPNEAWLLRQRLEKGDFQDGDRIIVVLHGNALMPTNFAGIPDTLLTVRAGRRLEFPRMADLALDGVLRSELNDKLTEHFAQYIREPSVRSTPLVRIAVIGLVGKPGYVYTLADAPLSDVIMQAGGPGNNANMAGIVIRRGADVIWDAQDTRAALADGMSLDRLHLRAGDEIVVPQERQFPWLAVFSVGATVVTLVYTLFRR
jgi:protein involved in polysaccharide export with SLBB domain